MRLRLERANELRLLRHYKLDSQIPNSPVLLHLLIYKIADGTMALSFANLASAGDDQLDYFGCSKLKVLQQRWPVGGGERAIRPSGQGNDGARDRCEDQARGDLHHGEDPRALGVRFGALPTLR